MAHRPGGLEVEASRDSIDITHLAGKEQMGADLALQRMGMEVAQGNAATGDKLVLETALAVHLVEIVGERRDQLVVALLAYLRPLLVLGEAYFRKQIAPKASREAVGAQRGQLLLWIGGGQAADGVADEGLIGLVHPVDRHAVPIVVLTQMARCMRGEFEHCRPAHTPMSDEEGASGLVPGGGDGDEGALHHRPHQRPESWVGDVEREERGYGGLHLVTQSGKVVEAIGPRMASRRDGHAVEQQFAQAALLGRGSALGYAKTQQQAVVLPSRYGNETMAGMDRHSEGLGLRNEAIDDGLGVLRLRKNALVVLCDQGHTMALEPSHRGVVVKLVEEPLHELMAAGIDLAEVADLGEGVGEVAAAATRHGHLGQDLGVLLVEANAGRRLTALGLDGGKESCRPAAHDGDAERSGSVVVVRHTECNIRQKNRDTQICRANRAKSGGKPQRSSTASC